MPRKPAIARPTEVIKALSRVLRDTENARPGHILRAAEMLAKYHGMGISSTEPPSVRLVLDVPQEVQKGTEKAR